MVLHPLAGQPAPRELLIDVPRLVAAYYEHHPDPGDPAQRVAFGTSGHRGVSTCNGFNRDHVAAMTQAVCDVRARAGIEGPLMLGMDTHALSLPALLTAVQVLAANGVRTRIQRDFGFTPTPVISHAILTYNHDHQLGPADGIVITPSHNPPDSGGFKYNPPHGGPAEPETTAVIQRRANELLAAGLEGVKTLPVEQALHADGVEHADFVEPYVADLGHVIDMGAIRDSGLRLGVDPMGGAAVAYWEPIAERYGLDLTVVNPAVEPDFRFMTVDRDGKIRMDCSSPYAMASLVGLRDRFDITFGNDPDVDRHGIVTPSGLMNPNHYLAVAIDYLLAHRPDWRDGAAVGKTLVSSAMIDRVVAARGRTLCEVPVGFKWFVDGLRDGTTVFGGEESAGASFLRRDGAVWTTDKDGIILGLLAAEITARTGKDPSLHYRELTGRFGEPVYERLEAPANAAQKAVLAALSPDAVTAETLAGDPVTARLTAAPGNGAAIGGLKVTTDHGWFAARPSGTEEIYKIYTESFRGPEHLALLQAEAQEIVSAAFAAAGV